MKGKIQENFSKMQYVCFQILSRCYINIFNSIDDIRYMWASQMAQG